MSCVQGQMGHLDSVDTKEMGEVIDMIKDLSEAIYYCTVTEAMEGKDKKGQETHYHYTEPYYGREMDRTYGRMYYDGSSSSGNGNSMSGGNRYYQEREYNMPMRDVREGRSPISRRMYMETKEMHMDKAASMKELEKYVQELTHDMVEMVADATPEEKQYLEKRIAALANKVGQMNA